MWTQSEAWDIDPKGWGLTVIRSEDSPGLSKDRGLIYQGANSGYQAINLAYHLGGNPIILLGYDMKGVGVHWFGKHQSPGLSTMTDYGGLVKRFDTINPDDYGIEIINCSRDTALNFPRMTINEGLKYAQRRRI